MRSRFFAVATAAMVSGCMMGPDYVRPRVDAPAARMTAPKCNGSAMNRRGAFPERAGVAAPQHCLHFGEDGEGDFLGRVGA